MSESWWKGPKKIGAIMKKVTLFIFLFVTYKVCIASFESGNTIYAGLEDWKRDSSANPIKAGISFGYVIGVHDALNDAVICTPSNATKGQLVDIVFNYLRDNPQIRHKPADELIIQALIKFYPCKKK